MSLAEDRPAAPALPANEPPVDPMAEHMLALVDGYDKATQKRLIMLARAEDIALIDDRTAEILIGALGLKEA